MELKITDFKANQFVETTEGAYGVVKGVYDSTDEIGIEINGIWETLSISDIKKIVCDKPPLAMDFTELAVADDDVLELMYDEAKTLFEEYDYRYTYDATMTIINDWNFSKAKLRSILRKHPLWDEETQMIKLCESPFHEKVDEGEISAYYHEFFNKRVRDYISENGIYSKTSDIKETIDKLKSAKNALTEAYSSLWRINYVDHSLSAIKKEYDEIDKQLQDKTTELVSQEKQLENRIKISGIYYPKEIINDVILLKVANAVLSSLSYHTTDWLNDSAINQEFIDEFKEYFDALIEDDNLDIKFEDYQTSVLPQLGQKVSKYYAKVCKKFGFDKFVDIQDEQFTDNNGEVHTRQRDHGYNMWAARFGDAVATKEYTEDVYISINFIDYLTSSFLYNATSCHSIDKRDLRGCYTGDYQGCNSAATISYATDGVSLVVYTINRDGDKVNRIGKEADPDCPIYRATKFRRMMVYIGEDKIICSRLYPDGRDGGDMSITGQWRALLQKTFADLLGVSNMWSLVKGSSEASGVIKHAEGSAIYPDWQHYDDVNVSYLRLIDGYRNKNKITVGKQPVCIECGRPHYTRESINCCHTNSCNCYSCGDSLDGEEGVEINGNTYCAYCAEHAMGWHFAQDYGGWMDGDDLVRDSYDDLWYFYDSDGIYVDEMDYWFCSEDNARRYGCVYDDIRGEWTYDYSDETYTDDYTGETFVLSWHDYVHAESDEGIDYYYASEENAIEDGWELDDASGEWYREEVA